MTLPTFRRGAIAPHFFRQHEIDPAKVLAIVDHLSEGGLIPPVVVARYGAEVMPLDGHHRLAACQILGRECDAHECDGEALEDFAIEVGSAEADRLILESLAP